MRPAISIIVPAYNAEASLRRCLDSIAEQSFRDFEVIIINDGSKDSTGQMADDFAKQDERFIVFHKQNSGVAAARQDGIDHAHGEYTLFVDSDDYITPNTFQELYQSAVANDADLVICDFMLIRSDKKEEYWHQEPSSMDRDSLLGAMFYFCPLWNKLIRTSCYRDHNIHFADGINAGEDQLFLLKILAANITIKAAYVGKALYHYDLTQNSDSISNTGVSAARRLLPLALFREEYDITPVQAAYDNAILHIAYDYTKRPDLCPDFKADFSPFKGNIIAAKGLPAHTKVLVLLRLLGIRLPLDKIKTIIRHR